MNTGQIHHGFTGTHLMLEIPAQAPIAPKPAECPFHHPPARNHHKAFGIRGAVGDLQLPATMLFDPLHDRLIAAIGPEELEATPAVMDITLNAGKELLQYDFSSRAVRHACTMDHDQQKQAEDVDHDMAFAPVDLLMHIGSALFPTFGRLDALAINNGGAGLGLPPGLLPDLRDQGHVEVFPQPAVAPPPIIAIDRLPRGKVVGQQPPRLPTAHDIEDGIDDLPIRPGARTARASLARWEQRSKTRPLFVIQIGWVRSSGLYFHPPSLSNPFSKRSLRGQVAEQELFSDFLCGIPWLDAGETRRHEVGDIP